MIGSGVRALWIGGGFGDVRASWVADGFGDGDRAIRSLSQIILFSVSCLSNPNTCYYCCCVIVAIIIIF